MGFAFGVPVGARSFAALTQVTILVNVESMLVIWGQVLEKTTYLASLKFGLLLKLDNACCLFSRLRLHNANCSAGYPLSRLSSLIFQILARS